MSVPVVVPYSAGRDINPWVKRILESYEGIAPRFEPLGDDDAYRRLLHSLWQARRTVVIVEHDVIPWYGAIEELYYCMGQWCSCSYRLAGGYGVYHGLGCTKISVALMEATAGIWDEQGHWSTLDRRLFFAARAAGQEPHPHRPPVIHLNEREYGEATP